MAEDKKELPSPENQGAWASATKGLLGNAKSVTDELFSALKDKDIVPPSTAKTFVMYKDKGPKNKADLDAKLSVTRLAVNTVDTAIQQCSQCMLHLGHEQQKKWAPLKVCEWRLALRERRPAREHFKDHVSEALEREKQVLEEGRIKLAEIANEGKSIVEECDANKAKLVRVVRRMLFSGTGQVAASDIDKEPLSPSSPSSPPPEGAASPEGEDPNSPGKAKPMVPSDHSGLLKRAPQLLEIVEKYSRRGAEAIKLNKFKADRAQEQVLVCFQKRWTENAALKKSLESQVLEMGDAIVSAEKALERMNKRITFFAETDLQPKYDAAQAILAKLRESKEALEDDLHHKLVSMKIDESCRKITAERATGVDPNSLPIAAMLESKKKKPLGRTSSSPAFGNGDRPGSPAGVSSPLKAAGIASLA